MGKMGKFSASDLKKLQKQLEKVHQTGGADALMEACAKELAARLLAKVVKRTPVGDYSKEITVTAKRDGKKHKKGEQYTKNVNPSGKMGGTLRRGWISATQEEAESGKGSPTHEEILEYVNGLQVSRMGGMYRIELVNPVEYASYVEYGHRTASHKGWVPGHFMLTISEQEIQQIAPKVLEAKIKKFLGECMG